MLPKQVFFEWALQMAKILQYLHETHYVMHTDVSIRNWFLNDDGNLVLGDFGCAKVLGPFGYTPIGTRVYYDEVHSPIEMKGKEGCTITQFSFNGDVW
jgi:serine/threonine protein kinase